MRSSASALLLAALLAAPSVGRAAASPPDGAILPPALAARVAACVAERWDVPADAVRLACGRGTVAATAESPLRLAGRGTDGWFTLVLDPGASATALRLRAGVERTVWVAARPLAAGQRLEAADLRAEPRVRWGPPAPDGEAPGPGWEVRRALAPGEPLARPAVAPPPLVASGEPVRLVWERAGVQVAVAGVALNSARRGESVRVRVEGHPERLTGIAIAPGIATLHDGGKP
jgi:flagella basal body P-ring formation protein FlgA